MAPIIITVGAKVSFRCNTSRFQHA